MEIFFGYDPSNRALVLYINLVHVKGRQSQGLISHSNIFFVSVHRKGWICRGTTVFCVTSVCECVRVPFEISIFSHISSSFTYYLRLPKLVRMWFTYNCVSSFLFPNNNHDFPFQSITIRWILHFSVSYIRSTYK